ncbi:hypothetical protein VNO77_43989 [Canavalia gladiata]|uniref:Uncharacterized protein n=1 Tax=Canavalia gladiata TaxID=3824 RepID=A0AAN9JV80_CANGL
MTLRRRSFFTYKPPFDDTSICSMPSSPSTQEKGKSYATRRKQSTSTGRAGTDVARRARDEHSDTIETSYQKWAFGFLSDLAKQGAEVQMSPEENL